jgi:hypothetical protein
VAVVVVAVVVVVVACKDAGDRHITNADLLYGILSSADKQVLRLMSTTDTSKNTPSTSIVSEY